MSSLPKKNEDGKALVSYSQMRMFKTCPKAYEFRYIDGLRAPLPGKVKVGSAFDKAANALNRMRIEQKEADAEAGITAAMDYMEDPGEEFDETDIAADDHLNSRIINAVEEYADIVNRIEIVSVQHEIEYAINPDVILIGNVDVVELSPDAQSLIITDNKTTIKKRSGKYTHDLATTDEQLTLYAATIDGDKPVNGRGWRVIDVGRKTPGRIESVHVKDGKQEATNKLAILNAEATLQMMENACETGAFAPMGRGTWKCTAQYCEFFNRCEYGSKSHTTTPMGSF